MHALQVTQIMVPLLKFYFHEDVRIAAVQCMPELLRAATLAVEKGTSPDASMPAQMLDFFWQPLLDAMHKVGACSVDSVIVLVLCLPLAELILAGSVDTPMVFCCWPRFHQRGGTHAVMRLLST